MKVDYFKTDLKMLDNNRPCEYKGKDASETGAIIIDSSNLN